MKIIQSKCLAVLLAGHVLAALQVASAATPGLPFTEDFANTDLRDAATTTGDWDTDQQQFVLAAFERRYGGLEATASGVDVTADGNRTYVVAVGDVDGDGDLDLIAGNDGQRNRLYLNNGTANPFDGVSGVNLTTDANATRDLALGDVDSDGDLDLIAGNSGQTNRLYLNNGTADPFNGVSGVDVTADASSTFAIALDDVDGDGDLDLIAGNDNQTNRLYLNNGTADPFNGVSGVDVTADINRTAAVVLGDVDGDGDLDLIAGNNNGQTNRLYLNNGTADPFNGVSGADVTADANFTEAVSLGDMDGDGDLDLIAGNASQTNRLYLNNGTAAPFDGVSGVDVTAETGTTLAVALGDVDGDGDLDLIAGNVMQRNRLYLNNGTASPFNGVSGVDVTTDAALTLAVTLGDVDGDGDLDLIAGNINARNRLYLNGGTASPFTAVTGVDVSPDADNSRGMAMGDVDGDGDLDLVAANRNSLNRLYLNNGTSDPFNGVNGVDLGADIDQSANAALGDLDGDGDLDLIIANENQTNRMYLNNGTADPFNGVASIDVGAVNGGTFAIDLGDMDGDGDLDLIDGLRDQPVLLFLNNGTANPFDGVVGLAVDTATVTLRDVAVGDLDGDSHLDLIIGRLGQADRLHLNNGTADPFNGVAGSDITTDTVRTFALSLGDVDNDGDQDLFVGGFGETNRLYLNNGTASPFDGVTGVNVSADVAQTYDVVLGDVDGDGDLDAFAGNRNLPDRLYLNNGTATPFADAVGIDISADAVETRALAVGDINGNGALDVFASNGSGTNRLYLGGSATNPFNPVVGADVTADANNSQALALGDVDGDGDLDLIAGNAGPTNRLYLNNGTANPFNDVTGVDVSTDADVTVALALGDVDGDGDLDLIAGNGSQTNRLYLNNGTASPFNGVTGVDVSADTNTTTALALGDVDGDGDLDLIAGNAGQTNRLYLNNGTANPFNGVAGVDVSADTNDTRDLALGDVDGDGDLDLIAGNQNQTNRLYLNNGTGNPFSGVTGVDVSADANFTRGLALGDVDGDGDLDLISGNVNQTNRLYLNNGTGDPFNGVGGVDVSADANITVALALGDVDRDGNLDLIAGNASQTNRLYLNNGTGNPFNGVSGTDVSADAGSTFAVALGDVDGDGEADLIAGNETNRLYRRAPRFATHLGSGQSLRTDAETNAISAVILTATATTPANTGIDYFMSNNGGAQFFQVTSGEAFSFPTTGTDLRWKAQLRSGSPVLTPVLSSINLVVANVAPVANDDAVTVQEDASNIALNVQADNGNGADSDGDGDALTIVQINGNAVAANAIVNLANGDIIVNAGATDVSYTPDANSVAGDSFTYVLSDGSLTSNTATVSITITAVNDAPTVANAIVDQTATEDQAFGFTLPANTFNDVDGDALTLTATGLPTWLSFTPGTGAFSGTPANADVGVVNITVTATDPSNEAVSDVFSITVNNVNDAPTVANVIADQAATEDQAFNFTVPANTFNDEDGDALTLSATGLPAWLSFTPGTGAFSGTPANADVGVVDITVTATDPSNESVSDVFALTVQNVNDGPTVANAIADQAATEDQVFNFTVPANTFDDVDGDALTLSATGLPAWLSFTPGTGAFSGTPANADVGVANITVTATDPSNEAVSDAFTITVNNVNDAPTVANAIADQGATEDQAFNFAVPANTFDDVDGDTLTLSATGLPAWLSFTPGTGAFSGTPANADVGVVNITVTATDPSNEAVSDVFALTVNNVNDAPTVANAIADQVATEDQAFTFTVSANTFNDDDGDALTLSATGLPTWLTFTPGNGAFSGTPANADVGIVNITVTATDPSNAAVSDVFAISVQNVNDAPRLVSEIPDQQAQEQREFSLDVTGFFADDDNGDSLAYSQVGLPDGLSLSQGVITGTVAFGASGNSPYTVSITASDSQSSSVTGSFDLVVSALDIDMDLTPALEPDLSVGGEAQTLRLVVRNAGTSQATGVVLEADVFGNATVGTLPQACTLDSTASPQLLRCEIGDVAAGASEERAVVLAGQSSALARSEKQTETLQQSVSASRAGAGDIFVATRVLLNDIDRNADNNAATVQGQRTDRVDGGASQIVGGGRADAVTSVDIDGDGDLDVVRGSAGQLTILTNGGRGQLQAGNPIAIAGPLLAIHSGDIDGDGSIDLVLVSASGVQVLRAGRAPAEDLIAEGGITASLLRDINGDGTLDLVIGRDAESGGALSIHLNSGAGLPATATATRSVAAPVTVIASGDFNGDGFADLVVGHDDAPLTVLTGVGDGQNFAATTLGGDQTTTDIVVVDLNDDGAPDLVVGRADDSSGEPPATQVYINDGVGGFGPAPDALVGLVSAASVQVVDIDQDGRLDIVTQSDNGVLTVNLSGSDNGTLFNRADLALLSTGQGRVLAQDLNGDGQIDFIVADDNGVNTFLNDGDGGFSAQPIQIQTGSVNRTSGAMGSGLLLCLLLGGLLRRRVGRRVLL